MKNASGGNQYKAVSGNRILSPCSRRAFIRSTEFFCGGLAFVSLSSLSPAAGKEAPKQAEPPPVKIPHVSIRMRCPETVLFGIASHEDIEITLGEVLKVHGYCAGGAAFAFRAAQEAFKALYGDRPAPRLQIKVHTSHHCCQAGALAYITGARTDYGAYGSHGDLKLIPPEEKMIAFIDKSGGGTATLRPRFNPHDTFAPLFKKARKDPSFAAYVHGVLNNKIGEYLMEPAEKLFSIEISNGRR